MWVVAVACCVFILLTMPAMALQRVSGCCDLLCFKPANNACSWLSSLWVTAVACCVSSLLIMPVLVSLESEWLLWLVESKPADITCSWPSSWWVALMSHCISSLLMMLVWNLQDVSGCLLFCALFLLTTSILDCLLFTNHTHHCLPACMCILFCQAC